MGPEAPRDRQSLAYLGTQASLAPKALHLLQHGNWIQHRLPRSVCCMPSLLSTSPLHLYGSRWFSGRISFCLPWFLPSLHARPW